MIVFFSIHLSSWVMADVLTFRLLILQTGGIYFKHLLRVKWLINGTVLKSFDRFEHEYNYLKQCHECCVPKMKLTLPIIPYFFQKWRVEILQGHL